MTALSPDTSPAEAEIARLRKGIQDYLDGNYEHPGRFRDGDGDGKCQHGQFWFEDCCECVDDHFEALLGPVAP